MCKSSSFFPFSRTSPEQCRKTYCQMCRALVQVFKLRITSKICSKFSKAISFVVESNIALLLSIFERFEYLRTPYKIAYPDNIVTIMSQYNIPNDITASSCVPFLSSMSSSAVQRWTKTNQPNCRFCCLQHHTDINCFHEVCFCSSFPKLSGATTLSAFSPLPFLKAKKSIPLFHPVFYKITYLNPAMRLRMPGHPTSNSKQNKTRRVNFRMVMSHSH